jgi:hypothetical protein
VSVKTPPTTAPTDASVVTHRKPPILMSALQAP